MARQVYDDMCRLLVRTSVPRWRLLSSSHVARLRIAASSCKLVYNGDCSCEEQSEQLCTAENIQRRQQALESKCRYIGDHTDRRCHSSERRSVYNITGGGVLGFYGVNILKDVISKVWEIELLKKNSRCRWIPVGDSLWVEVEVLFPT